jgi:N-methylhydantoinase A/oxoprolinase/acetone carboxylase beta subunit
MDWAAINRMLDDLAKRGRDLVGEAGVRAAEIQIERTAEGRFAGQLHEIAFDLPAGSLGAERADELQAVFNRQYRQLYGHVHPNIPIEILTWRVTARGRLTQMRVREHPVPAAPELPAPRTHRPVFWPQAADYVPTPIYDRYALAPAARIDGPAIVEERESTVLVSPGSAAEVDTLLNLVITRVAAPAAPAAHARLEVV